MQEFVTAIKAAVDDQADEEIWLEWKIDGVTCRAHRPDETQVAMLLAQIAAGQAMTTQIAGIINFFVAILDHDTHEYVIRRLMDRRDPYGIVEVKQVIEWMVEEFTGNPTERRSGSTPQQPPTGPPSTQAHTG